MKRIIIIIALLSSPVFGFLTSHSLELIKNDTPFLSYRSDIPWKTERVYLNNFQIELTEHPKLVGYILFETDKNISYKKAKAHIDRAVRYLTQDLPPERRINKNRIVVVYRGESDILAMTFLQLVKSDEPSNK